jgi:hypothetical protein
MKGKEEMERPKNTDELEDMIFEAYTIRRREPTYGPRWPKCILGKETTSDDSQMNANDFLSMQDDKTPLTEEEIAWAKEVLKWLRHARFHERKVIELRLNRAFEKRRWDRVARRSGYPLRSAGRYFENGIFRIFNAI